MVWLTTNWFWMLIFIVFIAMHLFGHSGHGGHSSQAGSDRQPGKDVKEKGAAQGRGSDASSGGHQH
jgi:hypothetical protein